MSHDPPAVLRHVAANLRRMRQAQGLSQDALSARAGISRRMLVAIESGDSNVSLATLDRLAIALGARFADLVMDTAEPPEARAPEIAWVDTTGRSHAILLGSLQAHRESELWAWTLAPGVIYAPEPDPPGWREIIHVIEGTLTLEVGGERRQLPAGETAIYPSHLGYAYRNEGTGTLRFVRNIVV